MSFGLVHFADLENPDVGPTDEQAIIDLFRWSHCKVVNSEVGNTSFAFNLGTKLLLQELKDVRTFTLGRRGNCADIEDSGVYVCASSFLEQLIDTEDGMIPFGLPRL